MTNAYVRIKRGDQFKSIEVDQLTDQELEIFALEHPEDGWKWAKFLAKFLRDKAYVTVAKDLNCGQPEDMGR